MQPWRCIAGGGKPTRPRRDAPDASVPRPAPDLRRRWSGAAMVYRHAIDATTYTFSDLRDLLAKATPPRSGDRLAGIASESAEQMVAARMALADVPLKQFLNEAVIPYEDDEVTRLIVDSHDASGFAGVSSLTVGSFRDWLLSDAATAEALKQAAGGLTAGMASAVSQRLVT